MGIYKLNKEEVLAEMDVAEMTLRNLIENYGFPHPRKAGPQKLFWLVSEIVTWLESCPKAWGGELGDGARFDVVHHIEDPAKVGQMPMG